MIITIDGSAGTGKSTVAREVAKRLRFVYFDTGAMYRSFTWFVLQQGIDIQDSQAVKNCLQAFDYHISEREGKKFYFVGEKDVTQAIRSQAVTSYVSAVSALGSVRMHLLEVQRHFAKKIDTVFEGRDLGTEVFPQAEIKIFLYADPKVRAERRLKEILNNPASEEVPLDYQQTLNALLERDASDSNREIAPLRCPKEALQIDTTFLSIDEVVEKIVNYCVQQFPNRNFL